MSTNIPFVLTDELSLSFSASLKRTLGKSCIYNTSFSPEMLSECPRRILYKISGFYNVNSLACDTRIANKNKWISIFKKTAGIRVVDTDVYASSVDYQISGSIDVVLQVSDTIMATQIKGVNDELFAKIQDNGAFKKDVLEVMLFLWLLELKDGLILYENVQKYDFLSFHIQLYMPMINLAKKKCEKLIGFQRAGKLIERPYKSKSDKECISCEFLEKCWGTYE